MACDCCNNCRNMIGATSVAVSNGVTTITVPADSDFKRGCYCIGLFTSIPNATAGTQINITDGSSTWTVMNRCGNYWRPKCALRARTLLKVRFYDDPAHFQKA